jgi:hypothetical protein
MAKLTEELVNSSTDMQGLTGGVELAQALSPADAAKVEALSEATVTGQSATKVEATIEAEAEGSALLTQSLRD